jgi:hypothetical protein
MDSPDEEEMVRLALAPSEVNYFTHKIYKREQASQSISNPVPEPISDSTFATLKLSSSKESLSYSLII